MSPQLIYSIKGATVRYKETPVFECLDLNIHQGLRIALIGKNGGLLKDLADISIIVKSNITSLIQEAHITILHCICEKLESN